MLNWYFVIIEILFELEEFFSLENIILLKEMIGIIM